MIILQSLDKGFVNGEVFYFVLDFDMERVLLQPANSLLQAAKKSRFEQSSSPFKNLSLDDVLR